MKNIAEKYNTVIIITNKTVKSNNGGNQHAGGNVTGYVQVRIAIKYVENIINVRRFNIEKDVATPGLACILSISSQGFYNTNYLHQFLNLITRS